MAFQYCVARRYTTTAKYPGGRRTEQTYDIEGRMLSAEVGIRKTAQLNRITPFEEETMDERGLVTKSLYDAARNLLKVTYPDGSSVTNTYDANYSLPLTRDGRSGGPKNWYRGGARRSASRAQIRTRQVPASGGTQGRDGG